VIDYEKKSVSIMLPNGVTRTAIYTGDQGCVCLAEGSNSLNFNPVKVTRNLPNAATSPWPMGDVLPTTDMSSNINMNKVNQAIDSAFSSAEALTAAFVVTYKGRIIAEKYADGITKNTALVSWSMGKSLSATIMGILIKQGVYKLEQPAPIPQWQGKGDGRGKIRIMDLMHMSSGLYCRAPDDPDYNTTLGYTDHKYLYTGGVNSFEYAANLPQQWQPNSVGRYRNCDPVLINYLNRLGIEGKGENYHTFPQKELFDKIGIRTMVMETDPYGNFLTQGYELSSARDWARLGNLYLQNGVWNGEQILPKGFTKFVSTIAEPWVADGRPIYGGLFWINGDGGFPIPKDAFMMIGAGGQFVTIIPSHDLVIVRLGHDKGAEKNDDLKSLNKAYTLLLDAVPKTKK
jgi:CubicO group peptidase (beta-lactamase class C family)